MGAWRHAWDAARGHPPTEDRVEQERAHGRRAVRAARDRVRRGEGATDIAGAQLGVALAVDLLAGAAPMLERPRLAWLVGALMVAGGCAYVATGAPGGAVLVVLGAYAVWDVGRRRRWATGARGALERDQHLLQGAGARIPASTALARPAGWKLGVCFGGELALVAAIYVGVRTALGAHDGAAGVASSTLGFLAIFVPLSYYEGRRRRGRALEALAA